MKNLSAVCALAMLLAACSGGSDMRLQTQLDSLRSVVDQKDATIAELRDSVLLLQYPASQRLAKIRQLVSDENFDAARMEISNLERIFPNSQEAALCPRISDSISSRIAAIEAEQQRIRALGFRALTTTTRATIDYNTVVFSNISIGSKFIHDVYETYSGNSWFEHTADRGNKYITCAMNVTSTVKNPEIPTLAFYSINGANLNLQGTFSVQMARWDDYGSYLGNQQDLHNSFAKVSTVRFKLGCELPEGDFTRPYVIVLRKANTQIRHDDRFHTPAVYYTGSAGYPAALTLDDFMSGNYLAIKVANL